MNPVQRTSIQRCHIGEEGMSEWTKGTCDRPKDKKKIRPTVELGRSFLLSMFLKITFNNVLRISYKEVERCFVVKYLDIAVT